MEFKPPERRPLRYYTRTFKLSAIARVEAGERAVDVAREVGVRDTTLRNWFYAARDRASWNDEFQPPPSAHDRALDAILTDRDANPPPRLKRHEPFRDAHVFTGHVERALQAFRIDVSYAVAMARAAQQIIENQQRRGQARSSATTGQIDVDPE